MASIAECLKREMIKQNADCVWAGDPDLCLAAYEHSSGKVVHPLNKIKAVIDAARRSKLFKSDGYIRACDCTGTREILNPCFKLK